MICASAAKAEAKLKTMGKTKVEAIKQKLSGITDCVEHVVNPMVVGSMSRYSHTYFYYSLPDYFIKPLIQICWLEDIFFGFFKPL